MSLNKSILLFFLIIALCGCAKFSDKPQKNIVFFCPPQKIQIDDSFKYLGERRIDKQLEDSRGGIWKGTRYADVHSYIKPNKYNIINEIFEVWTLTPQSRWRFFPTKKSRPKYGTFSMPSKDAQHLNLLGKLAKKRNYSFSGQYQFILFNKKYNEHRIDYIVYAVRNNISKRATKHNALQVFTEK